MEASGCSLGWRVKGMNPAGISVVIRAVNSAGTLPVVLAQLKCIDKDEIVLVDSGSSDSTVSIARAAGARILEIPQGEFTYGRSLNLGFSVARNEWILALSSHCIPIPARDDHLTLFRQAIPRLQPSVAALVGPVHNSEFDRMSLSGITLYDEVDLRDGFGFAAGNSNCLYRRSVWTQHPFNERLPTCEDGEWYMWAVTHGFQIGALHAAAVRYASPRPARVLYRRGRLDYQVGTKFYPAPAVKAKQVLLHAVKLSAYWILGKVSFASVRNGVAYKLGAWRECRMGTKTSPP